MAIMENNVSQPSSIQSAQITMIQNLISPITAVAPPATKRTLLVVTTVKHKLGEKKEQKKLFEMHPSTGH